jgi:hypothetical protein
MRVTEFPRPGEHLVCDDGRRERSRELIGCLEREADVLLHHRDVEPGLLGEVEQQRDARLEHRRADRSRHHYLGRELRLDPVALGEEQPLAECEDLHREADVDGELEHQPLAVGADVGDRLAELSQQRLNLDERLLVAADHDRERSALGLGDTAGDRGVEHPCADRGLGRQPHGLSVG